MQQEQSDLSKSFLLEHGLVNQQVYIAMFRRHTVNKMSAGTTYWRPPKILNSKMAAFVLRMYQLHFLCQCIDLAMNSNLQSQV